MIALVDLDIWAAGQKHAHYVAVCKRKLVQSLHISPHWPIVRVLDQLIIAGVADAKLIGLVKQDGFLMAPQSMFFFLSFLFNVYINFSLFFFNQT